ncbi:3-isopropylmalate dehydratase small subunit [Companilactobacillus sp.]|jgi:3-isopropylmalate/(R)-2-methylmalate dehydratase small subunit|uniref:3-isopropylmalate dehydratase small subunit n=1 Tax=Companilactobacillus sp. TaxID=2767905 RepID=UPI0025BC5B8E|nr:3-isopropylmalate dehydratase small subunit [Companilactobacillus sp.]MCH4010036.1 3-isopropylmalate dehydratase small subunit [Companilactobacillus sp.]MCH4052288.1 3-isopropylmalate dehydratase small subunit [Companilactobacillus sp.]MCH4077978.1 3-isopropylmalate dehydratase small subunit [Companilactobacillus sp.]MCH4126554.1 3-isopropylmalate dehydratase small subunit [Companilactobacillus sp.]MCH4132140.1 3-isopropylmalate dehydratase small subunit [Companilactobacillus sp.]
MKAITTITDTTVPIMKENIDTDQLIPKQFLKNILKTGYGRDLFFDWRYLPGGKPNPDFILNDADRKGASILITGDNFGCGSSREHAVWALKDYGFKVVIAGGYSDIFYMNSTKNGLLAIILPEDERKILANIPADEKITVDLPNQQVRYKDYSFDFDIDPLWKHKFINGLDDIAITMGYEDQIKAFEEKMPNFN